MLKINNLLLKALSNRLGRSATQLELKPRLQILGSDLPDLSKSEVESIVKTWNPVSKNHIDLDYWRFYKAFNNGRVNPMLVPDNIFWSRIIRTLNPVSITRTYINKSLYPIIFKGLNQPKVLINVISGIIYDRDMNVISFNSAVQLLSSVKTNKILKPTTASSGGRGVSMISHSATTEEIKTILATYGQNYICQEVVNQSKHTAVFNKSSLNTFRVNTLNINGKVTCECLMMRHGQNGSVVDNFAVGGVVCGMNTEGCFNDNNYNTSLKLIPKLPDGTSYSAHMIPAIGNVVATAIDAHIKFMPHIGHAAWDFAINDREQPVMIEVNLMLPGILMEQLTSRNSIFGDRVEEVIHYAENRNKTLSWTEFVGGW
ncbi:MAG: hypothetical protein HDS66_00105 [Bacteroidales bacterium]|nr:hypothetical protein [Bacteroidales bacterium]